MKMAVKWFPSWVQNDDKDKKEEDDNKLPPELEAKFKTMDDIKTQVDSFNKRLEGLDSISAYFEEQKREKKEAKDAADAAAAAKAKGAEKTPEEIAAELLTDPRKVISESTEPLANAVLQIRADQIRRQVF